MTVLVLEHVEPVDVRVRFLAAGLSFLAGATDVYGFVELHGLYVSFMSGNTTMLGMSLATGDASRSTSIGVLVCLFVIGAASGAVLTNLCGRQHLPVIILLVAAVLCVPLTVQSLTAYAFVLSMGSLNSAIKTIGRANISLTFVTGALVRFGQGIGDWLCGKRHDMLWMTQGMLWMSLLTGSCSAASAIRYGVVRPWPLPVIAFVLGCLSLAVRARGQNSGAGVP